MTREEQIIKASQLYAKALQKPFMDGAKWADQNPVNYDGKAMLHVLNKGHKQGYKDAIKDACELLARMVWEVTYEDIECNSTQHYDKIEFIEDFKKAMEEQQ